MFSTPPVNHGPISTGLGLITCWQVLVMEDRRERGNGMAAEPLGCGAYLVPGGEGAGTGLLFHPGNSADKGMVHAGDSVARACCASQSNRPKPVVGGVSGSKASAVGWRRA
jgi:hypothetical protein